MSTFPVSSSKLASAPLAVFVRQIYGLSVNTGCSLLRGGLNDSYLITDGNERYVFRVYALDWRSKTYISEEIKLLLFLREHGLSVSYPIADNTGKYIQHLPAPEGNRYGVLFSYAKGEKLQNFPPAAHEAIGEFMARFHSLTINKHIERTTYNIDTLLTKPQEYLSRFLPANTEEWQYMDALRRYLISEFSGERMSALRYGIVHLDIWFDNVNIDSDNTITVFDFDFCGNGWLSLDIGYYIMQLYHTEREEALCQEKLESFLRGYERITPIPEEEKALLPQLGVALNYFYIGTQCERFENWSNGFVSEMYLKRYIVGIIKRYADLRGILV